MKTRSTVDSLADWLLQRTARGGDINATLRAACDAAQARLESGALPEAEIVATVSLLEELGLDQDTLSATILFYTAEPGTVLPDTVRTLVEGQREAEKVWQLHAARETLTSSEGLRRLLLAIVRDLRVVFILLARQLARLRAADRSAEAERRALAKLTSDIHAPLANRLGIWQLKWELEDLAFRLAQPDTYKRIAKLLDERRADREAFIKTAIATLRSALADAGIEADIAGRPKHIYSIWKKMQRKGGDFTALYDIRALRLLVKDLPACYAALGVVHSLWPYIPGEFDDYIARPKGNHYQSLHTAVVGPEGKTLEVQIRSHEMHAHAELGVAAHWRYKEGGGGDASFERKVAWMRQLLDAKDEQDDDAALLAGLRTDLHEDRVYLLTPRGEVMDLPLGATVLDFAYHVHTDVGHRCRGAKVNGRIVPLTFAPASGDRIEILTGKETAPRRDWLSAQHGFLTTHRAREKVRAWFKRIDHAANLAAGRTILDRELKRLALTNVELDSLPPRFHLKTLDEMLVALALGDIGAAQVARALHEMVAPPKPPAPAPLRPPKPGNKDAMTIEGVGNLLTQLARCCQPLPGDAVMGFITRGRGVSVHRADCASLARLRIRDPSRIIEVEWGNRREQAYEVDVLVKGYDRKWLHKDITNVIAAANAHLVAVNTRVDPVSGLATMNFALRVTDYGQLSSLLGKLSAVPNVMEARRLA
ncbi:RelA/SpoT family protein [Tahibacter amnicola]|uniref:GTP pyrophosphokinase n=1 Tax=Tahibacter amnicola TaxID=2976241 RepID=A0ABY6BAW6_9GAMM|nr:bifunctional (p)ppGpp synthetase/guanosine-3',5'-bis(diphosphate) 3'-pyrophosphohydrolase [Tahibacter amnicola]UXI67208.1 bifunctional (p)ppGpp synthetase/guanosine-3',5'-bis(diphosphate) 3'-pyrophosphohydrolase [Tahibacter amnicola]